MDPKCYAVQCIVNEKQNPKSAPSPWDFVILPEDQATAIGSMHKKIGKNSRVVPAISSWTHNRRADHNTLQPLLQTKYNALSDEVINNKVADGKFG